MTTKASVVFVAVLILPWLIVNCIMVGAFVLSSIPLFVSQLLCSGPDRCCAFSCLRHPRSCPSGHAGRLELIIVLIVSGIYAGDASLRSPDAQQRFLRARLPVQSLQCYVLCCLRMGPRRAQPQRLCSSCCRCVVLLRSLSAPPSAPWFADAQA